MNTYLKRQTAKTRAESHIRQAKDQYSLASRLRELISQQWGDNGLPRRFPVSGGTCDHWPRGDSNAVLAAVREGDALCSESLRIWQKEGGMRVHTWRRMRDSILD